MIVNKNDINSDELKARFNFMSTQRILLLKRNPSLMFWINALTSIRIINAVSTLFYISRGLTLAQIIYTGMVWAIVSLVFETPSSYMADRWGRKKTIILGIILNALVPLFWIFAHGFVQMLIGFAVYALSFACFTGTDEALVYDTAKELGEEGSSLTHLGNYHSARSVFKIIAPVIAVFIARDLTDQQFNTLLVLDFLTGLIALFLALFLLEPRHRMDLKKNSSNMIGQALQTIKINPYLIQAIFNKTIIFSCGFIIWRYHQKLFLDLGISILIIGIVGGLVHGVLFIINRNAQKFLDKYSLEQIINVFNAIFVSMIILFIFVWHIAPYRYLLFGIYLISMCIETGRWVFFAELFNKQIYSYNRATTLSLTNFLKNCLDLPLMFIAGILVAYSVIYPFYFVVIVGLLSAIFLRLKKPNAVSNV